MSRSRLSLAALTALGLVIAAPELLATADAEPASPVANANPAAAPAASPASKPRPVPDLAAARAAGASEPAIVADSAAGSAASSTASLAAPAPAAVAPIAAPAAKPPMATPAPAKPETTLSIDIDLTRQRMTIAEFGKVTGSWPISSGREGFRSPTGTFRPLWASRMWFSKKYDNAPMPHAVFFSGGVAMHATQATGMLGHPASHGCIRQTPADAATTYRLVAKHGNAHTKIVVHGVPHDREPAVARSNRPGGSSDRVASRERENRSETAMRRVILVDQWGNRRVAEIPANDPRLVAYQRRTIAMARGRQSVYAAGVGGYYGGSAW